MKPLAHEFVLGSEKSDLDHMVPMAEDADMIHDDPNAVQLAPGEHGDLLWTFDTEGTGPSAWLVPGHMHAGMHGSVREH